MSFLPLKDLLPRAVRTAKIADQVQAAQVVEECRRVLASLLPPAVVQRSRPIQVKNGTLVIEVDSSAAAQELKFREADIIRKVNERLPGSVERMSFRHTRNV